MGETTCALVEGRPMFWRNPSHAEYWESSWDAGSCGDIHSTHIQWPNIEVLSGAGIVRHGLLDLCAN